MSADLAVTVEQVSRRFDTTGAEVWALRDVSMSVPEGDFVALVGRSGSGKTTLLNLIAGLDAPTEGRITIAGRDINQLSDSERTVHRREMVGFIFQSFGLLPLLSAQENVELALRIHGVGPRERGRRAAEVLDLVGLGQRRRHRPYELSGGEQQRVAIARAISTRPRIIIADEPTAELDSTTSLQIFGLLREVAAGEKATVITTTHDPMLIDQVDDVVELFDGRVVGHDVSSDLLTFGRARRREADHELSSPRLGATVGEFLDVDVEKHAEDSEAAKKVAAGGKAGESQDVARWSRPGGDKQ